MNRVLVDIGNSRLKYAVTNGVISEPVSLPCSDELYEQLAQCWSLLAAPTDVTVSCVGASGVLDIARDVAADLGWPCPRLIRVQRQYDGLRVGYEDIHGLGVDRWLAMLGAKVRAQGAFVVIDAGTAVTLDLVDANGCHRGGAIAPGLTAMRSALPALAHPTKRHDMPAALGLPATNTVDGIEAGTLFGLADLISGLTLRLMDAVDDPTIFLTGGDAPALLPHIANPVEHRSALVLEGLARVIGVVEAP